MLYGVYVYLCSNSLRRASRILEPLVERSHEAIRQWVQRLAPICDRLDVDRRLVRTIFVDETMIRIKGRQAWVWVAYEPTLRASLGSTSRTTSPSWTPTSSSRRSGGGMVAGPYGRTRVSGTPRRAGG